MLFKRAFQHVFRPSQEVRDPLHPPSPARPHVVMIFLRYTFIRAMFHRGYVMTSGLYFVVVAHLSASQIVLLGTVMSVILVLTDIPTGACADTLGRRWSLVIGQVFLAISMVMTGIVTAFPLILFTQVLWAGGWAFLTGSDVAWITDELDQPQRIARVLTMNASFELAGGAIGMVAFGILGWVTNLTTAIVVSGAGMMLLGFFVAACFIERNFMPTREKRWVAALLIVQIGINSVRRDPEILLVCVATLLLNGASMVAWLFPNQLIYLGFTGDPVLWYTAIGICAQASGVIVMYVVRAHIDGADRARCIYVLACFIGVCGLLVLAFATNAIVGGAGVLLASGICFTVARTVSVTWVNRRAMSDVRATVHSLLDQSEAIGEICGGFALAAIAGSAGRSITFLTSTALIACTGMVVALLRTGRSHPGSQ